MNNYATIINLSSAMGESTKAGIVSITASEIRFHLLDDGGNRTNPNATNVAEWEIEFPVELSQIDAVINGSFA